MGLGDFYFFKRPMFVVYKPDMHKIKGKEVRQILNNIQPGDILFRRHDGYISTALVPGFWTHAALYIGDDTIIHSTGKGVNREDILDFVRCDSISMQRLLVLSDHRRDKAISTALKLEEERVGYDWEFQDKNGKVYCTEFVNECYGGIFYIDYEKILNQSVLVPDDMIKSRFLKKVLEFKH